MKTRKFEDLLDRFGTDFELWPVDKAEEARRWLAGSADARRALAAARRVEVGLRLTRPAVDGARAARVQRLAIAKIAKLEDSPSLLQRCLAFFAMPVPRVAMAVMLTAAGFSLGAAIGNPASADTASVAAAPLMTASTDDVVY